MAMEAYSRGARVEVVEKNAKAYRKIVSQFDAYRDDVMIFHQDIQQVLKLRTWDIIFMDPPYSFDPIPWLERAASQVEVSLVFEHKSKIVLPVRVSNLQQRKSKRYGDTMITLYDKVVD